MRKIGWFDIYVEDMERAQAFYETVLDTMLSPMDDPNDPTAQMRGFGDDFTSHGAGGALVKLDYAQPGPGGSMVYFSCDDCAVEEARVPAAGGSIVRPKFSIGEHASPWAAPGSTAGGGLRCSTAAGGGLTSWPPRSTG